MKVSKIFYLVFLLLTIFGCSADISKKTVDNLVIYPPPPEPTRIQYLTSFSSSTDITGEQSGIVEYVAGESEVFPIIKPYGITVYKGKIYICDTILGGIEILDMKNKTFEILQPSGLGQMKKPINCFKDQEGLLYVVDAERTQIIVFDNNENFVTAFGNEKLLKPTDVFVTDSSIYVADLKGADIKIFSKGSYDFVKSLPNENLNEREKIYQPTNINVKDDRIYVSDFGDFKIKIYSTNGEFIDTVGSYGKAVGQFVRPKGIAVDDSLNLYVVDAGFENVQIFNKDGQLLLFFGGTYNGPGDMWLPAKVFIDYENIEYFQEYVYENFVLKYLIFVTNQYGPDKINVYGFVEEKE